MLNTVWADTWGGLGGTAPDGDLQGTLGENCPVPSRRRTRSPGYLNPTERASRQTSAAAKFLSEAAQAEK